MWRLLPSASQPVLYFRLDFLIEADLRGAASVLERYGLSAPSLRRRADDAFAPFYRTIWLSSDLASEEDPRVIRMLAMAYSRDARIGGGFDRNLRGERWEEALRRLEVSDWPDVVFRAKRVGNTLLRGDPELLKVSTDRACAFEYASSCVASRLDSRIHRLSGAARVSEEEWARREDALTEVVSRGISHPHVSLDCIGAVILSGSPLEV